ncbi:MAG: amidohydrolase family protein [Nitrososphaeria archaeon]|nr:amidohydrolase family protein [Nitrososphaeria archaeon]NIN53287.1 amidohydrolase family protein [Nitrososphaeria archaeon]NIQ33737.1 amidohydrolase family protein [Nitrososphaeria archaeon]
MHTPHSLLARNFPDVTIIVGHMGEVDYTIDDVKAAKKCENVMLETSWTSKTGIEYAAQEIGADRIIMDSDVPYGHPAIELKKIELLKIPEEEKALIRGMNLARILRLK